MTQPRPAIMEHTWTRPRAIIRATLEERQTLVHDLPFYEYCLRIYHSGHPRNPDSGSTVRSGMFSLPEAQAAFESWMSAQCGPMWDKPKKDPNHVRIIHHD